MDGWMGCIIFIWGSITSQVWSTPELSLWYLKKMKTIYLVANEMFDLFGRWAFWEFWENWSRLGLLKHVSHGQVIQNCCIYLPQHNQHSVGVVKCTKQLTLIELVKSSIKWVSWFFLLKNAFKITDCLNVQGMWKREDQSIATHKSNIRVTLCIKHNE